MAGRKPIVQCTAGEWRAIVQRMKSCVSPPEGYTWRFVWSATLEDHGRADRTLSKVEGRKGTFTVTIRKGMSESETTETLIHEVAHVFDKWDHHGWAGDHSDTYFIWYGRIHRRYHGLETG